jgi:signal peptidase II
MTTDIAVRLAAIVTVVGTVGCDRVTKHVARSTLAGTPERSFLADSLRLMYVENTGGFLSVGADLPTSVRTALFIVATGVLLLGLTAFALRGRWTGWPAFGLTVFLSGGVSNWFDRVMHGSVVDFVNIGIGPFRTGVFNVADVAIMLGIAIVVASEFRRAPQVSPPPAEAGRAE